MVIHSEPPTKTVNMMMAVQSVACFCVSSMVPAARARQGSAVAQALAKTGRPVEFVGINDTFGCSGHSYQEVLEHHGLTKEHIVDAVKTIWEL